MICITADTLEEQNKMGALSGIISAFGLSTAAGLNAYIPLLVVAVLGRMGVINLATPYDAITSWWAIAAIVVLGAVEFAVDKIPGADHINDVVQTFVRPAAGALLFAANSGVITQTSPVVALVIGLVLAGGVHVTKAVARPVINATTLGVGAPVVSVLEDVVSATGSLLAVFLPAVFLLFAAFIGYVVLRIYGRIKGRRSDDDGPTIVVKA